MTKKRTETAVDVMAAAFVAMNPAEISEAQDAGRRIAKEMLRELHSRGFTIELPPIITGGGKMKSPMASAERRRR